MIISNISQGRPEKNIITSREIYSSITREEKFLPGSHNCYTGDIFYY